MADEQLMESVQPKLEYISATVTDRSHLVTDNDNPGANTPD